MTAPYRTRVLRRLSPGIILLIFVALLLAVPKAARPLPPTPVLAGAEQAGNVSLARDCGYSAPLPATPGRSLWLFCDTPVYVRSAAGAWGLQRFIAGSTAGVGSAAPGAPPGVLSNVGGPGAADGAGTPAPFLATPAGLVTPGGMPCGSGGSYAASWVSGVTRVPAAADLLVTFNSYCVLRGAGGFLHEGFGLAEYDPATATLSGAVTVFAGPDDGPAMQLGSPVFAGGYLYLYGPACTAARAARCPGTVFEARVPARASAWTDPLGYRWRSGGRSWTADAALAGPVIAGTMPSGVSVAAYPAAGRRFVLVEQTNIGGAFTVYGSAAPGGPWTRVVSGRVPCRGGPGYANFCRAIIGHPELSTRGQIVLSYFDPAAGPAGHVLVAGFRW